MSNNIKWEYRACFPEKYVCPPDESFTSDCEIYRYSIDINLSDNLPYAVLQKSFRERHKNNPSTLCNGSGLSVYLSEKAADKKLHDLRNLNDKNYSRFRYLFKAKINHDDGKFLQTGEDVNHYTFWAISGKVDNKRFIYLKSY